MSLDDLKLSLRNLLEDVGRTDDPLLGLVINLGLASIGVVVYVAAEGVLGIVGLGWAIINFLGVVKWVVNG